MVDLLEMAVAGEPDGWVHLHRMANWNGTGYELSVETIDYFINFSKALLDERERLRSASRSTYNSKILDVAIERLNIHKPSVGRISLSDQSPAEFFQSTCWKHASAVLEKLKSDPLLMENEAIEQVAEESAMHSNGKHVDSNTVRRAWRDAQNHPSSGILYKCFRRIRMEAQKSHLAEKIAEYSHSMARFRTLSFSTEIPQAVRKLTKIKNTDRVITIATITPDYALKGSDHFLDEDGSQDAHAYFAEVLTQCIQVDGQRYTSEIWSGIVTQLMIFIGEQTVAKLERREPRKHWP